MNKSHIGLAIYEPINLSHSHIIGASNKINFYIIHGLQCDKTIRQVESELLDFFVSNFQNLLNETRVNFQRSNRLKNVIREAFSIIEKQLLKSKITSLK